MKKFKKVPDKFNNTSTGHKAPLSKIYIASPYSHKDKQVRLNRYNEVTKHTAALMEYYPHLAFFGPITLSHAVNEYMSIEGSWEQWCARDLTWLQVCNEVWVLDMDGWDKSVGVRAEIEAAINLNIPVILINTATLTADLTKNWGSIINKNNIGDYYDI